MWHWSVLSDTFELVVFRWTITRRYAMMRGNVVGGGARLNGTPISISADSFGTDGTTTASTYPANISKRHTSCLFCLSPVSFSIHVPLRPLSLLVRSLRSLAGRSEMTRARRLGWQMSRDYAASRFESFAVTSGCYMQTPTTTREKRGTAINIHDYHLCAVGIAPRVPVFCPLHCYETSSDLSER